MIECITSVIKDIAAYLWRNISSMAIFSPFDLRNFVFKTNAVYKAYSLVSRKIILEKCRDPKERTTFLSQ